MGQKHELGQVTQISPEAIGQPGQRRFRIRSLTADGRFASFWLEKEQLTAVGDAIESVLDDADYHYERLPLDDAEPEAVFPLDADVEMRLAQLSMGVKPDDRLIVLMGSEGADDDEGDSFTLAFDFRRGYELRRAIRDVVAAGRPPCPLCTAPMDPTGHICPRTNGHHPR
ncbi:MAG TPA: DUF3090 family protein [Tepidiformaceae bacterium]|nr:DUF3090 family protein [Tepidiformaceae bacterium]